MDRRLPERVPRSNQPLGGDLHDHELVAATAPGTTPASAHSPLWIARWSDSVGPLPAGWSTYTFWQWTNQPVEFPGDQDVFNGSQEDLVALANNGPPPPPPPPSAAAASTPAAASAAAAAAA